MKKMESKMHIKDKRLALWVDYVLDVRRITEMTIKIIYKYILYD